MSSAVAPKPHFLIYAPDYTDAEVDSRRRSAGATHVAHVLEMKEAGILIDVGIMLAPESLEQGGQDPKVAGTYLIIEASTLEEAKLVVQKDPFWEANIWDKEKTDIRPVLRGDALMAFTSK